MAKNTTKINALKLKVFCSNYNPRLLPARICIIKSQEQLRKFRILRIHDCGNLNILEASLKTLEITCYPIYAPSIVPILKKSGTLLQRLKLYSFSTREMSLLPETLKSFCPNITYLNLTNVEFSTQFFELIGNLQKLQFLNLLDIYEILGDEPKILAMMFAKLLPVTLQYLDLRRSCIRSYIDILFNNCYAPLKYLLIYRLKGEKGAKALIEFCIRRKTLNYVGVSIDLDDNIKKDVEKYVTLIPWPVLEILCSHVLMRTSLLI
ncbi:hypothetical protein F8M41_012284 [Gigaspora margarita]|uniref:Uncharacterized protein n=1 Tax=Gigaspora margarita TaxID=4874 RepID=A0A8H4B422_GIGMA|nr:hypothetical protein F8M41_012284 [Gigaspora margarita]